MTTQKEIESTCFAVRLGLTTGPFAERDGLPTTGIEMCDLEGRVVMLCTAAHDTPAVPRSFPRREHDLARFDRVREGAADASGYARKRSRGERTGSSVSKVEHTAGGIARRPTCKA